MPLWGGLLMPTGDDADRRGKNGMPSGECQEVSPTFFLIDKNDRIGKNSEFAKSDVFNRFKKN
jgi:hypothetical protein